MRFHSAARTWCNVSRSSSRTMARMRSGVWLVALVLPLLVATTHAAESRLTGRVLDAATQGPIANAEVELANSSGGTGFFRARTSASGGFTIDHVVADRYYTLTVSAPGYADFVLGGWRFPTEQRSVDVMVPLDRAGQIEVRVTRANGKTAVPNARVSVRSERPAQWWEGYRPPPAPVFTDKQGVATFAGLTAGYWTVTAEASGLLSQEARRVAVRRGETTRAPLVLSRPASIAGTVRLEDGSGVAGVSVIARGPAEGVGTTDAQGAFTIGELPPGKYRLEAQPDGFEPARSRATLALAEGESKAGVDLSVTPRPPELAFVLNREVFAPEEPVQIGLRSFRLGEVQLTLYRMPNERLLDASRDFRELAVGADTAGLVRERAWMHVTADGPPFSWREEEIPIKDPPGPGVYVLSGRAGSKERRVLFFVSELGLLAKRSTTKVLVSAASLKTSVGAEGVAIFTAAGGNANADPGGGGRGRRSAPTSGPSWADAVREARSRGATTNADGVLELPLEGAPQRLRVVGISEKLGVSVVDLPIAPAAERGGDQLFLYTERPLYRPGQTVFWKAFVRRSTGVGYALPEPGPVTLTLSGPNGATVDVTDAQLSPRGSADGSIPLPGALPLGEWTLTASAGKASGSATLGVQEYRKPEFAVEVTPDREVYVNGDEVRFQVAATYFFGAPVFGAPVRYVLFESRIDHGDDFDSDYEQSPEVGFGRVLKTGEARTDADGRLALVFAPERVAYDRRLTLEVEVVDGANRLVRGRGTTVVGRGLFAITVRPSNRLVMVGQPVLVEVTTNDHAGKPYPAAVTVELDQEAWNPIERRMTRSTRPLASATVVTDATGKASVALTPTPARSGHLIVRARSDDAKGNRITAESSVWIYDPKVWQYAYRYPALEAFADQPRYAPGDTARIVVNTDVGQAAVLATVEGRDLHDYKVVHLFGNTGLVEFPIRADYAPNVEVLLHVRKGKEVRTRRVEIAVAAPRRVLRIEISSDRPQYRPGDEARVAIVTRDSAGIALPAEVSLGVVDEAIYALRPDRTPDPHEVFYGRRPNWVTTAVSFPMLYLGGASKGEPEVRRDFRDVAFWDPTILTDAQGKAEVRFRFPDNLTTWRLTSRGATEDTRVGAGIAKTLVTKDLVARLATPRFFVAGDRASLVSVVTNRTATPLEGVEESIEAKGPVKIAGSSSARTSIPPRGESRHEWRVEVARELPAAADTSQATFTHRARGRNDSDALEVGAPVRARAVPELSAGAGVVQSASATVDVALPPDLIRSGSEVVLDLSPSPAAMMVAAADWLYSYEWGCTEQTSNAIRSATALVATLGTGEKPPGWQDPTARLTPLTRRLLQLQNDDGTWSWWRGGDGDPYLTALALDALARVATMKSGTGSGGGTMQPEDQMTALGEVDNAIQRAIDPMARLLVDVRTLDGEAYVLAHVAPVLALPNAKDRFPDLRPRLEDLALSTYSGRDRLSTGGLALAAIGHARLDRDAEAKRLLDSVMKRAIDEGGLHLPSDNEVDWFGEAEENTAYALSALSAIAPKDNRGASIVQWLARTRRGLHWRSTRTTGPIAVALADYVANRPGEARPDYRLQVQWNGVSVFERAVGRADLFGGRMMQARIAGRNLQPGANRMVINRQGSGSVYYAWEARAMVPSPGPPPPADQPLQVTREYLHAERTADRRGRPRYLTTPVTANEPIRLGEQVMVRLRLQARQSLDHLIVEDRRISGFEVDALLPEGAEWPWDAHAEERDDKVAIFLERIEAGETVVEYLLRPEITGEFTALPAEASGMYRPELRDRSAEARLEVRAK